MIPCFNSKLRLNIPDSRSLNSGHLTEQTARARSHLGGLRQRNQAAADQSWGFGHRLVIVCGQHLSRYGSTADRNQIHCLLDHIQHSLCSRWINQHEIKKSLKTSVFWAHLCFFTSNFTFTSLPVCLNYPSFQLCLSRLTTNFSFQSDFSLSHSKLLLLIQSAGASCTKTKISH